MEMKMDPLPCGTLHDPINYMAEEERKKNR